MSRIGVAVVGAGIAGLTCARALADAGYEVVVFDKGRGPGGRMASRRAEIAGETVRFDHGTRHFTATDPRFVNQVTGWIEQGVVAPWSAAGANQFVGVPGMNAPLHALAEGLDIRWNSRVMGIVERGNWSLITLEESEFEATNAVVAIPPEQAADLFDGEWPEFAAICRQTESEPCWTVMAAFANPLPIEKDLVSDPSGAIAEAARDSAKPGRGGPERWVIQASAEHSRTILDQSKEDVAKNLLALFFAQMGIAPVNPVHLVAHRWLYAQAKSVHIPPETWPAVRPEAPLPDPATYLYDQGYTRIALAGDWLVAPSVEGAWLSGLAAAELMGLD